MTQAPATLTELAREIHLARLGCYTLAPLTERYPALTISDAYAISKTQLSYRLKDGEKPIGKKIGVTSPAVQQMLGVDEPDFGFLTDAMSANETIDIAAHRLQQPRIEAEIAFFLRDTLPNHGVTETHVLEATACIAPCFEVVDSRIDSWRIGIVDTVADNASCGVYVIGSACVDPRGLDLAALRVTVTKNGDQLSQGLGSATMGSPLRAVAWLANTLGAYGVELAAGDVILSGSLVPLAPAQPGDVFHMELVGIGTTTARFF